MPTQVHKVNGSQEVFFRNVAAWFAAFGLWWVGVVPQLSSWTEGMLKDGDNKLAEEKWLGRKGRIFQAGACFAVCPLKHCEIQALEQKSYLSGSGYYIYIYS